MKVTSQFIKRSGKYWCATWSDMTIEFFVLMRYMKTSDGLINGRGFQNSVLVHGL